MIYLLNTHRATFNTLLHLPSCVYTFSTSLYTHQNPSSSIYQNLNTTLHPLTHTHTQSKPSTFYNYSLPSTPCLNPSTSTITYPSSLYQQTSNIFHRSTSTLNHTQHPSTLPHLHQHLLNTHLHRGRPGVSSRAVWVSVAGCWWRRQPCHPDFKLPPTPPTPHPAPNLTTITTTPSSTSLRPLLRVSPSISCLVVSCILTFLPSYLFLHASFFYPVLP